MSFLIILLYGQRGNTPSIIVSILNVLFNPQNYVPHIVVRSNASGLGEYENIQEKLFKVTEQDSSVKSNFVILELDRERDLHMTLIFAKGLSRKCDDLVYEIKQVFKMFDENMGIAKEYAALPNFGIDTVPYWFATKSEYSNNITKPYGWLETPAAKLDLSQYELGPSGVIKSLKK